MKHVKVAKYTKEKKAAAGEKYREELSRLKYSIPSNMLFILRESWRNSRGLFVDMVLKVLPVTAGGLFATYTDKYVVEFALGTSDRLALGLICAALITGSILAGYVVNAADMHITNAGRFKLSSYFFGELMRKKLNVPYEDTENPKINDKMKKAISSVHSIFEAGLGTMKDSIVAALQVFAYGGILSMLDPWLIPIIGVPAVAGYYINKHKMNWIWNMNDNRQTFDRQLDYITRIGTGTGFGGAKDIRIFGMQKWLGSVFDRVYAQRQSWNEQQDAWEFRHDILAQAVAAIGSTAARIYIVYLVMTGSIGAENPTIKDISFKLNKGERLAMVGLNGAGKTTLIKLMCGLYEPTEGEILLNGKNVNSLDRREYFKLFGTVFQDIDVLPVTVAENVSGKKAEETDMQRVFECMKKSGIYDKVMDLPNKENTRLVKHVFDDATDFSGGQLQKLALAKALCKDAPVLLLDEPTAALDPIAEQEMYLSYAEFSRARSSVFISHRLASTRFCDRILLIADGVVAEEGTHAELMQKGGFYAELFKMQSSYYSDAEIKNKVI
ncbi:MAG: ABC transporter ATP-binding protein/permease [Lachnospiraceae bacterium]|nr:ABC transporter ATP-binding protein/permease [Ruminococcus sp.]MCM1277035.1 ABC transporter ATP-binding protein/permease [Lachnospiraceae bacterium]